jgi:FkbM family methyltransferase
MLFANLIGKEGRVIAFEPTPWTYSLLLENTKDLDGVNIFQKAVSDSAKDIQLADYGPGYGAYNSAHVAGAADLAKESQNIEVSAVTLDEQLAISGLRPDIVKIDAEGFEHEVLLGMAYALSLGGARPLISIEVAGGALWAKGRNQALILLRDKGYHLFEISVEGLLVPHVIQENYGYDNLVAVPEEKMSDMSSCAYDSN